MRILYFLKIEKFVQFVSQFSLLSIILSFGSSFIVATSLTLVAADYLSPAEILIKNMRKKSDKPAHVALKGGRQKGLTPAQVQTILSRNIFNSEGTLGDAEDSTQDKPEEVEVPKGKVIKSNLPLKLLGVIFAGNPKAGLAMIKNQKSRVKSYLVGDTIMSGVTLTEVYESRVVVDHKGRSEYILLERKELVRSKRGKKTKKIAKGSGLKPLAEGPVAENFKEPGFERRGHDISLTTQYRENLLGPEMSKVLQDAKAEPNMVGGELQGFRLPRIREDSIYQKVGIQSGDIIHEINGIPLRDAAGAIRLLQSLRNETDIEVRVQRGTDYFPMNISVQ